MSTDVSNSDDTIDSRDVIKRIEELEDMPERDESETEELAALKDLESQAERYSDWSHGAQLIRDSYFKTYAQELADDIGAIDSDAGWPCNCIDWSRPRYSCSWTIRL